METLNKALVKKQTFPSNNNLGLMNNVSIDDLWWLVNLYLFCNIGGGGVHRRGMYIQILEISDPFWILSSSIKSERIKKATNIE